MQLAWLLRPQGQDIDTVIRELDGNRDLPILEAIRLYGPKTLDGNFTPGDALLRVMEGITGEVEKQRWHAPETGPQDLRVGRSRDAASVFPLFWNVGQAIEAAEATARRRLRRPPA